MTNQEAKEILEERFVFALEHYKEECTDYAQALEKGVKALETVEQLQAELDQWKRDSISDKAKLGEIKILEGRGLSVNLPCGVGDILFVHHRAFRGDVVVGVCIGYTWWKTDGFCIMFHSDTPTYGRVDIAFSEFGKTVFHTMTSAKKRLAELEGGAENE